MAKPGYATEGAEAGSLAGALVGVLAAALLTDTTAMFFGSIGVMIVSVFCGGLAQEATRQIAKKNCWRRFIIDSS
jgi:hypothetical protein